MRYVDPDGRYEKDVHKHLTFLLSFAAGYNRSQAEQISKANQGVDDAFSTSPYWTKGARADYHLTTPDRLNYVFGKAVDSASLDDLGVYLHAQQDSYSHARFGPWLGQGAKTSWDKTYNNPGRLLRAAQKSYNDLVWFRTTQGQTGVIVPFSKISSLILAFAKAKTESEKYEAIQKILVILEKEKQKQPEEEKRRKEREGNSR